MDNKILLVVAISIVLSLSFIRVTDTFYSTDSQNHFDAAMLILREGKFSTENFTDAWLKINNTYYPAQPIGLPLISLPVIAFFDFDTDTSLDDKLFVGDNFYQLEYDEKGPFRWMADNGTFLIRSSDDEKVLNLFFVAKPFFKNRTLEIFHNGKNLFSRELQPEWTKLNVQVLLENGNNIILLKSKDKCDKVNKLLPPFADDRCITFAVRALWHEFKEISPVKIENASEIMLIGNKNGTVFLVNSNKFETPVHLGFLAWSYNDKSKLRVEFDDAKFDYEVFDSGNDIILPFVNLQPGINRINFSSQSKCVEIAAESCAAIGVASLGLFYSKDFRDENFFYDGNWFLEEGFAEKWRWMSINSSIVFSAAQDKDAILVFGITSFSKPRNLIVAINGNFVTSRDVDLPVSIEVPIHLKSGKNILTFYSPDGCETPKENVGQDDMRCLTFKIQEIKIV